MKLLVAAFVCCMAPACFAIDKEHVAKFMEKMHKISQECIKETGATEADMGELMAHIIPPTSHEAKCMLFCFDKHFDLMTEDGALDQEGALKSLEPLKDVDEELYGKILKVFEVCGGNAVVDADPCITATSLAECAMKEGKKLGLSEDFLEV